MHNDNSTTHILLIEDDEVDVAAIRRALKRANVSNPLAVACDGAEALDILKGQNGREKLPQPCLLLVDINMPRMNGLEMLEILRCDPAMRQNIVFMLTTSDRNEDKIMAYRLGVAGYVLKDNLEQMAYMLGYYCQVNELPYAARM